ncbi:uncharacterized protein [Garra rufa]|uniref:uncharacterized protein n=1 Tax=Garra rufa TaxID=137080 RepID=UPI003CCE7D18
MSASVACESQHSADDYVSVTVSQSSEFNLMEMTEVEYLQHIIQSHIDAQGTETDSSGLSHLEENLYDDPDRRISCSPHSPTVCRPDVTSVPEPSNTAPTDIGEIKMLWLAESSGAVGCETTPDRGAELPDSLLDKLEQTDELRQRHTRPLKRRPSPPARVCLEKRFLSVRCHSTNTSRMPTHAQIEKRSKPDKMVKIQGTHPDEGCLFKMCVQQSELIIPTELSVSVRADRGSESVMRAPLVIYTDTADQQTADTLKSKYDKERRRYRFSVRSAPNPSGVSAGFCDNCILMRRWINLCTPSAVSGRGLSGPLTSHGAQRTGSRAAIRPELNAAGRDLSRIELSAKKRTTERSAIAGGVCFRCLLFNLYRDDMKLVYPCAQTELRRRIRLCCDELNLLVPFCYSDTDKATTLQWTTAFLKYIQEIHGDQLKQDFQSTFCGKTGLRLKPSSVSVALIDQT